MPVGGSGRIQLRVSPAGYRQAKGTPGWFLVGNGPTEPFLWHPWGSSTLITKKKFIIKIEVSCYVLNMLAHGFVRRCSEKVEITRFKAFHQVFKKCSLCTQRAISFKILQHIAGFHVTIRQKSTLLLCGQRASFNFIL